MNTQILFSKGIFQIHCTKFRIDVTVRHTIMLPTGMGGNKVKHFLIFNMKLQFTTFTFLKDHLWTDWWTDRRFKLWRQFSSWWIVPQTVPCSSSVRPQYHHQQSVPGLWLTNPVHLWESHRLIFHISFSPRPLFCVSQRQSCFHICRGQRAAHNKCYLNH